jgi:AraC family transcriptional regulator, activator of mtrCDE
MPRPPNIMLNHLTETVTNEMVDWLSRFLEMVPVRGYLDIRCFYGAPWSIEFPHAETGEVPYHAIVGGSAVFDDPVSGARGHLITGDILMLPHGRAHIMHDGGDAPPAPATNRQSLNLIISENTGTGERLDMLCGRFVLSAQHNRLFRKSLPPVLIVNAADRSASTARPGTSAQLAGLVSLMRDESVSESLGGRAMLNALSTAMFVLILRLASELTKAPEGLLALAAHPRLKPALTALFEEPERNWSLPELARRCNMSRATFARHFQERLRRSAADLQTDIRMTLAANKLKESSASTAAIAAEVGYQSEAAFQRAFKQRLGVTPAQWRRSLAN